MPTLELAHALVGEGFNVLMFDFRNHGESGGNVTTLGYHEVKDVIGAVQWLRQERPAQAERIGIVGFSMGAVTSIIAASQEPSIGAVVADSPFSDLRSYLQGNMPVWTGLPNVPFTWTIMAILPPLIDSQVDQVSPVAVMPDMPQPVLLIHADGDTAIPADESRRLAAAGRPEPHGAVDRPGRSARGRPLRGSCGVRPAGYRVFPGVAGRCPVTICTWRNTAIGTGRASCFCTAAG